MSLLFDGLHRILGLGLVCGALLTLGGSGQKEILRLGCACLTVVVLLSMLQRTPIPAFDLNCYENIAQQRVDETQTELRRAALRETEAQLEQRLADLAADMELQCRFSVMCSADSEGDVTVRQVECIYQSGPREGLSALRTMICSQLEITQQQLIIREETP